MLKPDKNNISFETIEQLSHDNGTPALVIDAQVIRSKYQEFREALHEADIYYAIKANPAPELVKLIHELGAGFEVASEGELELLFCSGVSPSKIISSNPAKTPSFIKSAFSRGITTFALDSYTEIEKLSRLAPGSKVYVRLSVSNEDSEWPLDRKFGVETEDAVKLLIAAKKESLEPYGITFHVGSQCTNPTAWIKAIEKSKIVWESAENAGIELKSINVGGGFPCEYTKPVPSMAEISQAIRQALTTNFPETVEIVAEPGRALVGEAGIITTTVIAKAIRNEQQWFYLDIGIFNGLMEAIGGIKYKAITPRKGAVKECALAGPSCDSMDIIADDVQLPELEVGDRLYLMSAGAYTTSYASQFDGFPIPEIYLI